MNDQFGMSHVNKDFSLNAVLLPASINELSPCTSRFNVIVPYKYSKVNNKQGRLN